ncbi:MAG: hypothetical protein M5T61_20165 [Acidimicrobiia bacterium]|nr:hypothetical protein [Acidimicrobiia bacterium]
MDPWKTSTWNPPSREPTGPTASNRTARRWIVLAVVVTVLAVGGVAAGGHRQP